MAFRRKFRRTRRPFVRRRPLARVRRTWVTSVVPTVCQPLFVPLEPCGEDPHPVTGRILLVDNPTLESSFSDRAVVKRIVGDLWVSPTYDQAGDGSCTDSQLGAAAFFVQAFAGLRKLQTNAKNQTLDVEPLVSDFDYSEAEWLKTWQHYWFPRVHQNYTPSRLERGCGVAICPDVHTSGLTDNTFVDGTGTINIETDCGEPQTANCDVTQDAFCEIFVDFPSTWHIHYDIRKSIPLREFEELALEFSFLYSDPLVLVNPRAEIVGGIKCLLQY